MTILKFEQKDMDDVTFANKKLEFIINQAAQFNKLKYHYIVIPELDESSKDYLFYQCIRIIALFKQVPVYVSKKVTNVSYFDKTNTLFKQLSYLKLKKKIKGEHALIFSRAAEDEEPTEGIQIFKGFTEKDLTEISELVYKSEDKGESDGT